MEAVMSSDAKAASYVGLGYKLPFNPEGWYGLGFSSELKAGQVLIRKLMGQDIVLFRTQSGKAVATDPYCPHMGAHFGHGGTVEGENLRCPFHGFCFDTNGQCVSTGYGTKPNPKGRLKVWPFRERNGILLVYYHPLGMEPQWEVPELPEDNYRQPLFTTFDIDSHPQETSENSVDLGHLSIIHGYEGVETLKPLRTEGPYLTTKYKMVRSADFLGLKGSKITAEFEIHVHGLGYSFVDVSVPAKQMRTRHFVLATPVADGKIQLRIGLSLKHLENRSKVHPLMALLPTAVVNKIVESAAFKGFAHDVQQDFDIWQNKTYVHPPALAMGDGPVGQYRLWTKQFYHSAPQS
ncbi:MAG: Rieske 2Fe-2S domain-containing protein [Chitinophagales bacterium]|nr:Rieske 2Fe-2S domain-containing protein [Chitinophagales bacterium]